jgi:hypothetical protein
MPGFLRQSTASQARAIGPFLNRTDGVTAETALTINAGDVKLIIGGGASQDKNSGGGTHRANGVYSFTFNATDTATVGEMQVSIDHASALPVFDKFFVLEEAVYDAMFAASAAGYQVPIWAAANSTVNLSATTIKTATDVETDTQDIQGRLPAALVGGRIDSNVGAISSDSVAADNAEAFFDGTGYAGTGNVIPTVTTLTNDPTGVGTLLTRLGTPSNLGGGATVAANLSDIEAQTDDIGTAGAGLTAVPWNAAWDAEVQSEVTDALEVAISDSIPADGTIPSVKQALYMLTQFMLERNVASTTVTVRKADGATSLFTLTLNDATTPTNITRAT